MIDTIKYHAFEQESKQKIGGRNDSQKIVTASFYNFALKNRIHHKKRKTEEKSPSHCCHFPHIMSYTI